MTSPTGRLGVLVAPPGRLSPIGLGPPLWTAPLDYVLLCVHFGVAMDADAGSDSGQPF